jgi:type IV pilus assembly protein PilV
MVRPSSCRRSAAGFTLIEALVSLLVLSIGLLGLAGLQLTSLRTTHGSALRSQATLLAYDITDRMRANRRAALNGDYAIALTVDPTAGTVAGDDLVAWKQALARTLPGGDGSIVSTGPAARPVFTIRIQWLERDATDPNQAAGAAPVVLDFETETQL